MGIMAFVGNLGTGKTLGMTFVGLKKYNEGRKIFSNYNLAFPHTLISTIEDIDKIKNGIFLGDELWLWLDARRTTMKSHKVINDILTKSRKRNFDIYYTTQHMKQIDVRIQNITDFIVSPQLSPDKSRCMLYVYDGKTGSFLRQYKFYTETIFSMYDTNEEVEGID